MADVYVLGAGGHAKVVIATLRSAGHSVRGAFSDRSEDHGRLVLGVPVLGPIEALLDHPRAPAVIAIGDNRARRELAAIPAPWLTCIHPGATVHESATIAEGTVVFAGVVVQPEAHIGVHAILNTACTIDHECQLEDYAQIGPGAHLGGNCHVGEGAFVGLGASVIHGVRIGAWAVVGAGAAVIREVPDHATVVGVPAAERVAR
jgi:sugar O-acyltransferase (sialic acid O-acetyltransferase NeuD family)